MENHYFYYHHYYLCSLIKHGKFHVDCHRDKYVLALQDVPGKRAKKKEKEENRKKPRKKNTKLSKVHELIEYLRREAQYESQ